MSTGSSSQTPFAYSPDAVLTAEQVAEWLGVSKRSILRLPIKRVAVTPQRYRYLASDVYLYLRGRAA